MRYEALQHAFESRRAWRLAALYAMAAFGFLSAILQLVAALWNLKDGFPYPTGIAVTLALASISYGIIRAWPKSRVIKNFSHPEIAIEVKIGDLFDQDAHLVIGMSDTFDSNTTHNEIINSQSIAGQAVSRLFGGDHRRLDRELSDALRHVTPVSIESPDMKSGKLKRYAIGTVAVLGTPSRRLFAVAYARMGNDLIARATVDDLWEGLNQTWSAIRYHGQREAVALPVIGTEFARVSAMDKESMIKMISLSFIANSRRDPICRKLVIVIHPKDRDKVDMYEVASYLNSI